MSTAAQIAANTANAQSSTGPRTEEGKAASSQNGVKLGLFSGDFIRAGEEELYVELNNTLLHDLCPIGVVERNLVDEIRRAMWRLRRCGAVESRLSGRVILSGDPEDAPNDPMEGSDAEAEKIQTSVDRARSQAHRLLRKCTAELRRLQTDRLFAMDLFGRIDIPGIGIADYRAIEKARACKRQSQSAGRKPSNSEYADDVLQKSIELFNSTHKVANRTQSQPAGTPRNAECPCGSGLKHKRCCGKNAPAMLHVA